MCMIDYGEPATACVVKDRKARKPHVCDECGRKIKPGEVYENASGIWDGDAYTFKTCQQCGSIARAWLSEHCGGWCYGGLLLDLQEHAQHSDNEKPEDAELAGIIRRMERKWK